ncbi:hypothetical protein PC129_g14327 [Phytophthora cactorum]|uniref:Uncharacterized protein n=1 Tax=Phytophthora cactorum TaxID=29920 RepID=A0A8T1HRS0_9STRA|nr:hypothetical protein PC112_g15250 [Phytophthora cactorum]KAG2851910.1 hypothetical protein PC113_g15489 [Phytophthora cactorum]KAG2891979.1 hypothetical protein PC114_g16781 [Phytophthora cactorum]KAG2937462.1 hypothetical protein PC115_g4198 [Phytophthora cactorum]KAG2961219.1 hypothetical protein PC118_g22090 [Phytophthora cactorum]
MQYGSREVQLPTNVPFVPIPIDGVRDHDHVRLRDLEDLSGELSDVEMEQEVPQPGEKGRRGDSSNSSSKVLSVEVLLHQYHSSQHRTGHNQQPRVPHNHHSTQRQDHISQLNRLQGQEDGHDVRSSSNQVSNRFGIRRDSDVRTSD